MGLYRGSIGVIQGLYWGSGKENGNYYLLAQESPNEQPKTL